MSRPLRVEYPGALYHVTARGNERKPIFRDDHDRESYLATLAKCHARLAFQVHAFCLMSNHVHLAIETSDAPLSRIMLTLHGSYSQAFNRRHRRVGHLFQGRYKAFLVQKDRYLLALVRYIHENPVKARMVQKAEDYPWSSDSAYRASRPPRWLEINVVLSLLASRREDARRAYASLMATQNPGAYANVPTFARLIRGDEVFATRVVAEAGDQELIVQSLTPERVAGLVAKELGVPLDHRADWRLRAITGHLAKKLGRIPLTRTAPIFGRHGTTLVRDLKRLENELASHGSTRRLVDSIGANLVGTGGQR